MQEQYNPGTGFPATFMKDLKDWSAKNVDDKKMLKLTMQFASFAKREVDDIGVSAMDVQLPFDQRAILSDALKYMKKQIDISEITVINLEGEDASSVPDRLKESVTPGKPSLWLH